MTYEHIISEVGNFGWWQAVILGLLSLPDIAMAFVVLLPVFIGAAPRFHCAANTEADVTSHQYINSSGSGSESLIAVNVTSSEIMVKADDVCKSCDKFVFDNDFTSIVSEVSCQFVGITGELFRAEQ